MTEILFVLAPGQNHFFFELAEALRAELESVGVAARVSTSGFAPDGEGERVNVLLPPHEYFALEGAAAPPPPGALRRTIMISAEQPETIHFRQNLALAAHGGAVFDINARAVQAYRRRGVPARLLRLGYTPAWDRYAEAAHGEREDDVLFLGAYTPRRGRVLSEQAGDSRRSPQQARPLGQRAAEHAGHAGLPRRQGEVAGPRGGPHPAQRPPGPRALLRVAPDPAGDPLRHRGPQRDGDGLRAAPRRGGLRDGGGGPPRRAAGAPRRRRGAAARARPQRV